MNAPQPVIDSNTLREAALRASWHRDHRVARRREAWRWMMFWLWKYGRRVGMAVIPMSAVAWLALQVWPLAAISKTAPTVRVTAPAASPSPQHDSSAGDMRTLPEEPLRGIRLLPAAALQSGIGRPELAVQSVNTPPDSPKQPLRLTPEIQTAPKEP